MMSLDRTQTLLRAETAMVSRDPAVVIWTLAMPLVLILFLREGFVAFAQGEGVAGADLAVPGFAVMFVMLLPGWCSLAFFREHAWRTWPRLQLSAAAPWEVAIGKTLPYYVVAVGQLTLLFLLGWSVLGMHVRGSVVALAIVMLTIALVAMTFGWALLAVSKTSQQTIAFGNLGGMVLGAVGGALQPVEALPGWAERVAPLTPHYWAIDAFRSVLIEGAGVGDVLGPTAVLLCFAAGAAAIAASRYRSDDTKLAYL